MKTLVYKKAEPQVVPTAQVVPCLKFWAALILLQGLLLILPHEVRCQEINLNIIAKIESSNNPLAYNKASKARGMYQITEIAWLDVQNHYPNLKIYPFIYAYKPQVARLFVERLFTINKGYLRHFGLEISLENQLKCYNQGIGLTKKGITSQETKNYIKKYKKLAKNE